DAAQRGQAHCQIAGALLTRGAVAAADAELDQALAVSARIEDDLERMSLQVTIGKISSRKHLPDEAAFVHHIIKRAVDLAASLARLDTEAAQPELQHTLEQLTQLATLMQQQTTTSWLQAEEANILKQARQRLGVIRQAKRIEQVTARGSYFFLVTDADVKTAYAVYPHTVRLDDPYDTQPTLASLLTLIGLGLHHHAASQQALLVLNSIPDPIERVASVGILRCRFEINTAQAFAAECHQCISQIIEALPTRAEKAATLLALADIAAISGDTQE